MCKYFARLRHNAPGDRNPNTLKFISKILCSSCNPALSVHDNANHRQDNTRDQHVNTSLDHSYLSWCWGPNDLWVLLRNFSILWRRKKRKKKDDKKTKAFYDWATTGIPVITVSALLCASFGRLWHLFGRFWLSTRRWGALKNGADSLLSKCCLLKGIILFIDPKDDNVQPNQVLADLHRSARHEIFANATRSCAN